MKKDFDWALNLRGPKFVPRCAIPCAHHAAAVTGGCRAKRIVVAIIAGSLRFVVVAWRLVIAAAPRDFSTQGEDYESYPDDETRGVRVDRGREPRGCRVGDFAQELTQ